MLEGHFDSWTPLSRRGNGWLIFRNGSQLLPRIAVTLEPRSLCKAHPRGSLDLTVVERPTSGVFLVNVRYWSEQGCRGGAQRRHQVFSDPWKTTVVSVRSSESVLSVKTVSCQSFLTPRVVCGLACPRAPQRSPTPPNAPTTINRKSSTSAASRSATSS